MESVSVLCDRLSSSSRGRRWAGATLDLLGGVGWEMGEKGNGWDGIGLACGRCCIIKTAAGKLESVLARAAGRSGRQGRSLTSWCVPAVCVVCGL